MKTNKLPKIKFIKEKVLKNGQIEMEFEIDDAFIEMYKKEKGVRKASKKGISNFLTELLVNYAATQDKPKV